VMHQPRSIILRERERVAMDGLFSPTHVYHVISWVLHDSNYDRTSRKRTFYNLRRPAPIAPSAIANRRGPQHQFRGKTPGYTRSTVILRRRTAI